MNLHLLFLQFEPLQQIHFLQSLKIQFQGTNELVYASSFMHMSSATHAALPSMPVAMFTNLFDKIILHVSFHGKTLYVGN